MKYRLRYGASIGLAIVVVLLFLLTSAGSTSHKLEPYFPLLLVINALVVFGLLVAVPTNVGIACLHHFSGRPFTVIADLHHFHTPNLASF